MRRKPAHQSHVNERLSCIGRCSQYSGRMSVSAGPTAPAQARIRLRARTGGPKPEELMIWVRKKAKSGRRSRSRLPCRVSHGLMALDKANYCSDCGTATANVPRHHHIKGPLSRSRDDVKVAGVCAGFARHLGVDVTFVRILWTILTIFSIGVGLIVYIACWIVMPRQDLNLPDTTMNAAQPQG